MALKGDRYIAITDVSFFMDQVAEKGGILRQKTGGSGAALDQQAAEVEYAAVPSGEYIVGVLLDDMVDQDLTRTHMNFQKTQQQKGSKVAIMREGWVVTNMVGTGVIHVPVAGAIAYAGPSGMITSYVGGDLENPPVGRWESTVDEDGYAKVYIKLPK
jgi:hypothetical protein